jgi:hypothetical protein
MWLESKKVLRIIVNRTNAIETYGYKTKTVLGASVIRTNAVSAKRMTKLISSYSTDLKKIDSISHC